MFRRLQWFFAKLPLEPSLSRTLMEANENGCLSQALTVAAMLSAVTSLLPGRRLIRMLKRWDGLVSDSVDCSFSYFGKLCAIYFWLVSEMKYLIFAKINRCSSLVCLRVTVCSCFSNFLINFITHCNVHAAFLFPFHLFLALLEMLVPMISHLHWMLFKQCMLMLTCRIWRILVVNQKFKHTG